MNKPVGNKFLGPLLDGIHSIVGLQVYGIGFISVGPLNTNVLVRDSSINQSVMLQQRGGFRNLELSACSCVESVRVPPLLGAFYLTVGLLHLFLDERVPPKSRATGSPEQTATSLLFVLADLYH
jgi:hypothetical protein